MPLFEVSISLPTIYATIVAEDRDQAIDTAIEQLQVDDLISAATFMASELDGDE